MFRWQFGKGLCTIEGMLLLLRCCTKLKFGRGVVNLTVLVLPLPIGGLSALGMLLLICGKKTSLFKNGM